MKSLVCCFFILAILSIETYGQEQHLKTVADQHFNFYCSGTNANGPVHINNRIDGCSGPNTGWEDFFAEACNKHDVCYAAPWRKAGYSNGQTICDNAFEKDLVDLCAKIGNNVERANCFTVAATMSATVKSFGRSAFDNGQSFSKDCHLSRDLKVKVHTSGASGAATHAGIYLFIHGSKANFGWVKLNAHMSSLGFAKSSSKSFNFHKDIGHPRWVCVYNDGTGFGPDWFLQKIIVNDVVMPFGEWVRARATHISDNAPHSVNCPSTN